MRYKANRDGKIALRKSRVKAHVRQTKSGKMVQVKDYENKKKKIDAKISEKYNIASYGLKGMEIQSKNGKNNIVVNSEKTREENWSKAVKIARDRLKNKKERLEGFVAPNWGNNTSEKSEKRILVGGKVYRVRKKRGEHHRAVPCYNIVSFEKDDRLGIWDKVKHPDALKKIYRKYLGLKKPALSKSLTFNITGQRIIDGLSKKIGEIRGRIEEIERRPEKKQNDGYNSNSEVPEEIAAIRYCEQSIKELERLIRNINPKQKYQLNEYELRKYNL